MQLAQTILFLYAISYSTPLCNKFFTALDGNFCANSIISYCITFATFILLYYKQRWIRSASASFNPFILKVFKALSHRCPKEYYSLSSDCVHFSIISICTLNSRIRNPLSNLLAELKPLTTFQKPFIYKAFSDCTPIARQLVFISRNSIKLIVLI